MPSESVAQLNKLLAEYKTRVAFFPGAVKDYKSFTKGSKQIILGMIVKQAQKGPQLKPKGNGIRLQSPLHEFGKIKRKAVNLCIIYRPKLLEDGICQMEIIAIGPRDNSEIYKAAQKRLPRFLEEFGHTIK